MNEKLQRFIAIIMLLVPGLMATYGFLAMKDALFAKLGAAGGDPGFLWGKFLLGLVLFAAGTGFIGGWIFFRDRKRNYVAPRFREKRNRQ